jgi:hypothetical protein
MTVSFSRRTLLMELVLYFGVRFHSQNVRNSASNSVREKLRNVNPRIIRCEFLNWHSTHFHVPVIISESEHFVQYKEISSAKLIRHWLLTECYSCLCLYLIILPLYWLFILLLGRECYNTAVRACDHFRA